MVIKGGAVMNMVAFGKKVVKFRRSNGKDDKFQYHY